MIPILSSKTIRKINENIKKEYNSLEVSLDLGKTKTRISLLKEGFIIGENKIKTKKIRKDDKSCYIPVNGKIEKVQYFSDDTKSLYKLVPTSYRPILQISGTSMHKKAFVERIEKEKLRGKVIDSGTGLGYTAIAASRTAKEVFTFEIDKNVIEIAKLNPYSKKLFRKKNIKLKIGDITKEMKKMRKDEFDYAIFDPGTPKSSGEFFSLRNYKEAFRIIRKGGKIYHYLPKHHIKRGRDFGAEVIKRIKKAGFSEIERQVRDSYAVAKK